MQVSKQVVKQECKNVPKQECRNVPKEVCDILLANNIKYAFLDCNITEVLFLSLLWKTWCFRTLWIELPDSAIFFCI